MSDNNFNGLISILKTGISLEPMGVNEYAFSYENVLLVITEIEKLGVPILGGDVLTMDDGQFGYTGDRWSCNRRADEPIGEYFKRSIQHTRNYIEYYHKRNKGSFFFSIVANIGLLRVHE